MLDHPVVYGMIIFGIFALGEFISIKTKARVPMLFSVMIIYLALLWTKVIPTDIVSRAYMQEFASILPAILIVHMGTLIPFKQLKEQWKAVIIALSGIVFAALLIFAICVPIIGYAAAISGIGPLTGGTIAYLITTESLKEIGMLSLVSIPALVIAVQGLIGMPLANYFLRKRGNKVVNAMRESGGLNEAAATLEVADDTTKAKSSTAVRKTLLPEKYQSQIILIFQVFVGGAIAVVLGELTGINYSLWALVVGIIGTYFGFFVGSIMERANSFGILMALLMILVMGSMNTITPQLFTASLGPVALILVVGITGILVGGFVSSKLFKWDPNKGMPVALTALFGFPGDYILCEEISRSVGRDEKEQKAVFNELLTPMLVGGFTTVTVASVVIAGILMGTLS